MQSRELPDYYAVLGVDKAAAAEDIKRAYHQLCLQHHPDKGGDKDQFMAIQEAYEMLSDMRSRNKYDNALNGSESAVREFDLTRADVMAEIFKHFDRMVSGVQSHFEANIDSRHCQQPANLNPDMYYVVGNPIQLNALVGKKRTLGTLFKKIDKQFEICQTITSNEVYGSFPANGTVRVFLNEQDAQRYVHCLRQGLPHLQKPYFQACVFGVKARHSFNPDDLCFGRVVIGEKLYKASLQVPYFEADVSNLKVMTSHLQLPACDSAYLKGRVPDYGYGFIMTADSDMRDVGPAFRNAVSRGMKP